MEFFVGYVGFVVGIECCEEKVWYVLDLLIL